MNILYVEDEPQDAQLVERYMRLTPHQVTVVSTVQEAQAALEPTPDLILADVLLGNTRAGYKFVRDLRSGGYTQPIIAITGLATPYDLQACYEAGFTDVLTKPYSIQQFADLLRKYES